MNQRVKRAIAAAMSLTMVATATPVSPLYNAIQNAVSSTMMQANAEDIFEDYANKEKFSLSSIGDLNAFAEAVNSGKDFSGKTVELADNFDMGDAEFTTPIGVMYYDEGYVENYFKGTFDGNNKTIKLNINKPSVSQVGLFGVVDGGTIKNVTVTGTVKGYEYVGGVIGMSIGTTIYNCGNKADITASNGYDAGITGFTANSSIYNCYNTGAILANANAAGGIASFTNEGDSYIYNCYNTGTVEASNTYKGGMFGRTYYATINLSSCYSTEVTGGNSPDGQSLITAEQLAGTDKIGDKTLTELLNDYVNEFNSKPENAGIVLLNWEQGQNYPILKAPIQYTTIDGTNLKWTIDEGTLKIELDDTSKTGEQYADDNAIPDWTDVYTNAAPWRNDASSIKSIEIADGVTRIGNWAFYNCNNLTTITIPASVKSIGEAAYCYDWKVQSVEFKGAMPEIGDNAFYDVGTAALIFPENDDSWKNFFADNADSISQNLLYWKDGLFKTSVYNKIEGTNLMWSLDNGRFTVDLFDKSVEDENLNAMPDWTFASNVPWYNKSNSIKSVEIGKGVTHIGAWAFASCKILSDITIPDSVTSIGGGAFGNCSALKNITIPDSVTSIGIQAFYGCAKLASITFESDVPTDVSSNAFSGVGATTPVTLYYPEDNESWGVFLDGANMDDKIDKNGVLSWAGGKFTPVAYNTIKDDDNATNLMWYLEDKGTDGKKLTIDLIDKSITDEALNTMPDWENLHNTTDNTPWYSLKESITSVEIKNGVTNIGATAFNECHNLEEATIPNTVTSIGESAFYVCTYLKSIKIPDSVTSIADWAFGGCEYAEELDLGKGVETIGKEAFAACIKLEKLTLPDSVTSIGEFAFGYWYGLKELNLGNGIKNIGDGAFAECIELESVTIPSCVKTIGDAAFLNCEKLSEITFEGSMPEFLNNPKLDEFNADAFSGVNTEENPVITLRYPKDDTTWETFLKTAKSEGKIDENGVLSWEGGKFTAGSYLNWNNIDETALRWTISANGTLYIDKQENPSGSNFEVPAYDDDAPWNDSINKIRFVDISSSVTDVNDTSFKGFNGQAILVLENGYNGTMPTAPVGTSNYDTFGGGQFIYSKSQLTGASLSLAGKIGINLSFYITEKNPTIIINDTTIEPTDPNLTIKNNVYTYTLEVAPKDAYDDITFEVTKDSETIIAEDSYNVKDKYVEEILKDENLEDVYNMVRALDAYINSSRIYFNEVDEDEEIKASITSALEGLNLSGLDGYAQNIPSESVEGVEYYGSSLILNSGVKLRHYIEIADYDNVKENIVIKLNDNAVENVVLEKASFTSNSHDVYYFETEEFNPKYFNTNVSVLYDEEDISEAISVIDNYSVLSFINLALNKNADTKLGTTCKSIYNYYLAADTYNKN